VGSFLDSLFKRIPVQGAGCCIRYSFVVPFYLVVQAAFRVERSGGDTDLMTISLLSLPTNKVYQSVRKWIFSRQKHYGLSFHFRSS
jgi:hypothetical protein